MAGTGQPLIPLGLMLLMCSVLGLILQRIKMPMMLACMVTGMLASTIYSDVDYHMSESLCKNLSDIGVFFVLFSSGMEIDPMLFLKRWKIATVQTILQLLIGGLIYIGIAYAGNGFVVSTHYCFHFSFLFFSTIIMNGWLGGHDDFFCDIFCHFLPRQLRLYHTQGSSGAFRSQKCARRGKTI